MFDFWSFFFFSISKSISSIYSFEFESNYYSNTILILNHATMTTEKDTFCIEANEKNSSDAWVEKCVPHSHRPIDLTNQRHEESGKVQLPRKTRITMIDPRGSSFKNFLLRSSIATLKIFKKKKKNILPSKETF